jgi:hypothetical protein
MDHLAQWKAFSARIQSLARATELHTRLLSVEGADPYGRAKTLHVQLQAVRQRIVEFLAAFEDRMPRAAVSSMQTVLHALSPLLADDRTQDANKRQRLVVAAMLLLMTFEAELTYLLSDQQQAVHMRVERALVNALHAVACMKGFRSWFKDPEAGSKLRVSWIDLDLTEQVVPN